ncbi:cell envelope-related Asp23 family protein [Geodermatophilus tzadiensis]|uniref:Cell envelope-related Asp23 family protein n=1 Tax=Geodermatophilus tzadiensis TaxID=1137988 RepID=A0A2T0TYC1_9ACTN|nr:Asp23/Gls24 family envelope stress response protein [Geodermatophilus tzadiensis]PRY50649.1 cell envelope-related Asp23 family protein [Geodermatophilus tzadiensis]
MTATPAGASASGTVADAPRGELDGRGRLVVADRVVERIAAQAAAEVDRATGSPRRLLGVAVGSAEDRPQVDARVDWPVATVSVVMSVAWPAPVLEVTEQVRRHVTERLAALAGVRTAGVDIRVTALPGPRSRDRRVS